MPYIDCQQRKVFLPGSRGDEGIRRMRVQVRILPQQLGKPCGNLVIGIDETKAIEKIFDTDGFGGANRFSQQLLAYHFCVVDFSGEVAEEALRVEISTKPVDENTRIH